MFFLTIRRPPRSTRTDTLFPYPTLFRSCAGLLAASRRPLPAAAAVPADGPERRLPHRRPVQPVRVLRGAAAGVVRSGAAWFGCATGQRGLHSIAVTLTASLLFLLAVSLFFGVPGPLNREARPDPFPH